MIKVQDLRLSWSWVEVFPELLSDPPKLQSRWGRFDSELAYAAAFTAARQGSSPLSLPWPEKQDDEHKHFFWFYYLHEEPRKITSARAFRALVPLRETKLAKIAPPFHQSRVSVVAYHYPHGLGLELNAELKMALPLADMVEKALELARETVLEIQWRGAVAEQMKLLQFGETALSRLRSETFGALAGPGVHSSTPFSVATFVRGDVGVDPPPEVENDGPVHRALEALCSWNPYWTTADLHPLSEHRIRTRHAPTGHVLYGLKSGRAVWFPGGFLSLEKIQEPFVKKKVSLGCYRHNLALASLQTESLARLMVLAQGIFMRGETLSASMQRLVRRAAGILGQTYGGDPDVYSSFSPAAQLEENGWVANLAYVRNQLNMPGVLHRERKSRAQT